MELRELGSYSRVPLCEGNEDVIKIKIKPSSLDGESCQWDVDAEGSWTIQQLKQHIKEKFSLHGKRMRLIVLGRLMEDSNTVSSYGLKDGDFVHAAISDEPPPETHLDIDDGQSGPSHSSGRTMQRDVRDSQGRGFNQLIHTGFSQQEIEYLRAQFHSGRPHLTMEQMIEREEEWLEDNQEGFTGIPHGGLRLDRRLERARQYVEEGVDGNQADLLLGIVMGFIFGVVMLFWIWDRGINGRQKLGIMCGIGANLTIGMLRLQSRSQARLNLTPTSIHFPHATPLSEHLSP